VTSATDPVGIGSQDARVQFTDTDTPESMGQKINDVLILMQTDLQKLAALQQSSPISYAGSGNFKWVSPIAGQAEVWAVSDTATAGSTGIAYHVLTLYRNGAAAVTQTYDTRQTEVPKYLGGAYLGQTSVAVGDVLSLNLAVTGAPAPTLTTANFSLLLKLREN